MNSLIALVFNTFRFDILWIKKIIRNLEGNFNINNGYCRPVGDLNEFDKHAFERKAKNRARYFLQCRNS